MPQMKPMNWMFLMMYNLFLLMIMNINLFFFDYKNILIKNNDINYIKFNLKW